VFASHEGIAPRGFDGFYRAHWTEAVRLAYLLTGSASTAEDLAQDAFVAVHQRFREIERPAAYLRSSIVNGARSQFRRASRRERALRLVSPVDATEPLRAHELLDVVDALPYRERAVLVLRYYADLPDVEIASLVGCRPATVRTAAARALRRLRKEIADD
jgi:RNA polymerase sigma factor (sigma-70 family)